MKVPKKKLKNPVLKEGGAKEEKILQCFKVWWYVGGSRPTVEEFGVRRLLGNSKAHQPTTLLMNIIVIIISIIIIIIIIVIIITRPRPAFGRLGLGG